MNGDPVVPPAGVIGQQYLPAVHISSSFQVRMVSISTKLWWLMAFVLVVALASCGGTALDHQGAATPIKIRITLSHTRVISGSSIKGDAVLTNTTSKTIIVQSCALDGRLDVGLVNSRITYSHIDPLVGCNPSVRLAPGRNQFQPSSLAYRAALACRLRSRSPSSRHRANE
jgi:hypothetical protein